MAKKLTVVSIDPHSKKFTVRIPGGLDFRLGGIARKLGLSKGEFVLQLVEQGVARYGVDAELKAVYAKIAAVPTVRDSEAA